MSEREARQAQFETALAASRRDASDKGGCSVMTRDDWKRCGARITHRSEYCDMPLCIVHAKASKTTALTCQISEEHFVGLNKTTPIVKIPFAKRPTPKIGN